MRKLVYVVVTAALLAGVTPSLKAEGLDQQDKALLSMLSEAQANLKAVKAKLKARGIVIKGKKAFRLVEAK